MSWLAQHDVVFFDDENYHALTFTVPETSEAG